MKIISIFALFTLALTSCTANQLCNKRSQCQEEGGTAFEDDSTGVCVANANANYAAYAQNDEEACLRLGAALQSLDGCRAGLDCDDFDEADLGGNCKPEREEVDNAQSDVDRLDRGFLECTSLD
jgi:hypothetical protein